MDNGKGTAVPLEGAFAEPALCSQGKAKSTKGLTLGEHGLSTLPCERLLSQDATSTLVGRQRQRQRRLHARQHIRFPKPISLEEGEAQWHRSLLAEAPSYYCGLLENIPWPKPRTERRGGQSPLLEWLLSLSFAPISPTRTPSSTLSASNFASSIPTAPYLLRVALCVAAIRGRCWCLSAPVASYAWYHKLTRRGRRSGTSCNGECRLEGD